jgi:hypothetical protein
MGTMELAMAIWEAVEPYALASAAGALIGVLVYALVWA